MTVVAGVFVALDSSLKGRRTMVFVVEHILEFRENWICGG